MGVAHKMETLIHRLFHNWQLKIIALIVGFITWLFVSNSIMTTKTIPSIPIRIVNIPQDKTIQGLLPNGVLSKRTTLTLTGKKDVVEQLEPGDLEVLLDSSNQPNEWTVQISKKNLVSLNPDLDLFNISNVEHPEFVIKLSPY